MTQMNWADPRLIAGAIAIVVMMTVGIALVVRARRQKTAGLRERFGPEYDQAVRMHGSTGKAEAKLVSRETRVEKLRFRELSPGSRERFVMRWKEVQARFLDHPKTAVTEADELVTLLMLERGYPDGSFDQRAADLSVNHPHVVTAFRNAHAIATRVGPEDASTEELRVAMVQYRSVFDELMDTPEPNAIKAVA